MPRAANAQCARLQLCRQRTAPRGRLIAGHGTATPAWLLGRTHRGSWQAWTMRKFTPAMLMRSPLARDRRQPPGFPVLSLKVPDRPAVDPRAEARRPSGSSPRKTVTPSGYGAVTGGTGLLSSPPITAALRELPVVSCSTARRSLTVLRACPPSWPPRERGPADRLPLRLRPPASARD
jgi:hypothetical protein